MALATCRECEAEVSTEADPCPHCRVPEPAKASEKEERRFPSGPAPHGGPWDDWARWKLRSENPDAVVQAPVRHGMEQDHAREEVERQ